LREVGPLRPELLEFSLLDLLLSLLPPSLQKLIHHLVHLICLSILIVILCVIEKRDLVSVPLIVFCIIVVFSVIIVVLLLSASICLQGIIQLCWTYIRPCDESNGSSSEAWNVA
jgi:hypothetical protein